jgi:hypothetical protein
MNQMKIFDSSFVEVFVKKVKLMRILIKTGIYLATIIITLMSIVVIIISHNLIDILRCGILSALLYLSIAYTLFSLMSYSFLYFFIVCFYCKMRFRYFNNSLITKSSHKIFTELKLINNIIEEHNIICNQIISYNKFWKTYYSAFMYTLIPINLMLLQQILFEEIHFITFIALVLVLSLFLGLHLILNIIIASINGESTKSYKYLQNFYINKMSILNTKHKIKVIKK